MDNVARLTASGDYVALPDEEHYRIYFDQVRTVCTALRNWAKSEIGKSCPEGECIALFGERLLRSIELLRLKYLAEADEKLKLDLNESGFPHLNEIVTLENDAKGAASALRLIPPRAIAVEDALDHVFAKKSIPTKALHHLGRRRYLEAVQEAEFLGAFSIGQLKARKGNLRFRKYTCTWACYNVEDNLVYLHWMEFDQSAGDFPIAPGSSILNEFLDVLKRLGSRAAPLVVFATELDRELPTIHPKVVRRLRIGPILSSRFSFDESELARFLRREGDPNDVVFSMETEIIVSSRQVVREHGWLMLPDTLQEVFEVPEDESERFHRRLSDLQRYLFMPHRLWQVTLAEEDPKWMADYAGATRYAFEKSGEIHEI